MKNQKKIALIICGIALILNVVNVFYAIAGNLDILLPISILLSTVTITILVALGKEKGGIN